MDDIEVLEKLLAKRQQDALRYDADSYAHNELVNECAALSHAIDAMKAKSEAEVVCEWLQAHEFSRLRFEYVNKLGNAVWSHQVGAVPRLQIDYQDFVIDAPTLADLAKKIGEGK